MSETIRKNAIRIIDEVFNRGNTELFHELYAANFVRHQPAMGDIKGEAAFKQYVAMVRSAYPDLRITIEEIIVEGDKSVFRFVFAGTHSGQEPFFRTAPTNKRITIRGCSVSHWQDGKV